MSELEPHAEKLSAEEAISRIIAQKTCVRKNFHGEWFTGIVQTVRTCSTGRVLVNVMYIEDNDDEDLDADEFLCLVDVDSLAQFDSGSISVDIPCLDLSAKSGGKESGSAIATVKGDKMARHEALPKADPDNTRLHDRCQTTACFGFAGKIPIFCSKHQKEGSKYENSQGLAYSKLAAVERGPKRKYFKEKTMSSTERGKIHRLKKKIALTEAVAAKHLAENTVHDAVTDLTEANEEILQLKKQLSRAQKKLVAVKAEKDDAVEKCALYKKLYESLLEK